MEDITIIIFYFLSTIIGLASFALLMYLLFDAFQNIRDYRQNRVKFDRWMESLETKDVVQ